MDINFDWRELQWIFSQDWCP